MLHELAIEDYAVVDRLRVRFHTGLNLLTGETGSGKSIVVDALGLLLGGRASADMIRSGKERALNTVQSQRIVAMVCSPPPEGRARWSVRLIAAEAAKRKLAPPVSRETIRILLESHDLKPWRGKKLVYRGNR